MSSLDKKIFGGRKFSSLLEEIYNNQLKKSQQISGLIEELKPLIQDIGDATLIVPLLKEYLDLGLKNDEQLIKMSTIIQRALNTGKESEDDFGLSIKEKNDLLDSIKEYNNTNKKND